ncbi:MAG TPA: hypothetical protein VFS29_12455 [Motilibacteraceae bacterium]|nr:hypothetical protein [Motilibacteraceae bacterium]
MSDLQCPATFLLLAVADGEPLPPHLVQALAGEHVAEVYARPADPPRADVADALAAALSARRGTAEDVDVRGLEEVADLHRGERVVVVLSPAQLAAVLHVARRSVTDTPTPGWTELAVDADGWVLRAAPARV